MNISIGEMTAKNLGQNARSAIIRSVAHGLKTTATALTRIAGSNELKSQDITTLFVKGTETETLKKDMKSAQNGEKKILKRVTRFKSVVIPNVGLPQKGT